MPGRQSHGVPVSKKPKHRVNNKKRSINAFAIATEWNPETIKIRQHRLGDIEGDHRPTKRTRTEEKVDGDETSSRPQQQRKKSVQGQFDKLEVDTGSDSEGNEWQMGHVDDENDSDLDSDEAFGESDEEKFEGFAFSGSSTKGMMRKSKKDAKSQNITLLEEDGKLDLNSALENDSLGDKAVDLAAMLDDAEEESELECKDTREAGDEGSESQDGDSGSEIEESDDSSSVSSMENEGDPETLTAIHNLIDSLPQAELSKGPEWQLRDDANEYSTTDSKDMTPSTKIKPEDILLSSTRDPAIKRSLKPLLSKSTNDLLSKAKSGMLEVPLAKRQQDRLNRSAAYEKSKETLDRWTDTIKHNRRAEHLIFPLPDVDTASANTSTRLQPTTNSKPFTELEATIRTILEESGLAATNTKDLEDKMMEFEGLQANSISLEEVKARRAQLRMARELLFREETKAKRIKKIKSKSYRRVHRHQREKDNQVNKRALAEAGIEPSDDEREIQDRQRAEERMGAKHRNSKWAKATKQAGRAAWDQDARAGIIEMAKREEELRKRIEGKSSRNDDTEGSESSNSDSDDENIQDSDKGKARVLRKLESMRKLDTFLDSAVGSKLSNMKFMLKSEASRKKENDMAVEQIRRDLAGELSSDEAELDFAEVGRRKFGPGSTQVKNSIVSRTENPIEFEEPEDSSYEDDIEIHTTSQVQEVVSQSTSNKDKKRSISQYNTSQTAKSDPIAGEAGGGGVWSRTASQKNKTDLRRGNKRLNSVADVDELDISNSTVIARLVQTKRDPNTKQTTVQTVDGIADEDSDGDDIVQLPYAIRDQELIKRAFAGADVVGEFEAEKRQAIVDEDEKVIDNTLPGWGNWVGDGVSKKDKRQNQGRFLSKSEGIKEQDRKDAKLDRVIINEKRVKKNSKYLASNLPHPFETRQQYERSLRLPVGPEWTTKETFQEATKPRILMKQGIIAPLSKPLF